MSALAGLLAVVAALVATAVATEKVSDRRYTAWFKRLSAAEKDAYLAWLRMNAGVIRRSPSGLRAMYERERSTLSAASTLGVEDK